MNKFFNTVRGLADLARQFQSPNPTDATLLRQAFKDLSLNDNTRIASYLMQVVGFERQQQEQLKTEVSDLKELLEFNNIVVSDETILAAKKALDAKKEAAATPTVVPPAVEEATQPTQEVVSAVV